MLNLLSLRLYVKVLRSTVMFWNMLISSLLIRCSSFKEKWSLWRSNLWEGMWSCHTWRTFPSFNETISIVIRALQKHGGLTSLSFFSVSIMSVASMVSTLVGMCGLQLSLKINWSLWTRNLWEGMWSCNSWRTDPYLSETISCVVVATVFAILCSSLKVKWSLWRSNLWEGMWSCHSWRIHPSFTESMVAALLFTVRWSSFEEKWSLWRSNLWEGMWSCQVILRKTWRTLLSFSVTLCICTLKKCGGLVSL